MKTNLISDNSNEKVILDYIEQNASDNLVEKINTGKKTMADCMRYIISQAKKKASNGCAMVEDKEVFGWAIHFFEEDSIKAVLETGITANAKILNVAETKPEKKVEKKAEKKVAVDLDECTKNQISMFDLFGGMV